MPTDPQPAPRRRRDRRRAVLTGLAVAAVVLALPLLAKGYKELRAQEGVDQVALGLAGGREAACRVVQPGAAGCPAPGAAAERYASAVRADWYLVAGYVLAGLGVFGLGGLFLYGSGAQRVARWWLGGVLLAGAADGLENLALLRGLDGLGGAGTDTPFRLASSRPCSPRTCRTSCSPTPSKRPRSHARAPATSSSTTPSSMPAGPLASISAPPP